MQAQSTIADSISHLWPVIYMRVTLTRMCRCNTLSVGIVMNCSPSHVHCHPFTEIVSLILTLMVQENYTEEPIAEMEDAPAEEPAKADGGDED